MGFGNGKLARIWAFENKGNYSTCRLSISRKDKNTGAYVTDFTDGFVRLVGKAHIDIQNLVIDEHKGALVRITSCEVTNVYTAPDGKVSYAPHYTIFGFEEYQPNYQSNQGNNQGNASAISVQENSLDDFVKIPDDAGDELPFV